MSSRRMAALAVLVWAAGPACVTEAAPGGGAGAPGAGAPGAEAPGAEAAARRADLGFRGTVVEVRVERDPGSGLPFTYVTARVDEPLKGGARAPAGALVTWRILGGALDGRLVTVADAPSFRVGEEAYWLLAEPRTGATTWPILAGLGAGKWVRRAGGRVTSADGAEEEESVLRAALGGDAR